MISSIQLEAFLAVVREQSFSKAAKKLYITQSALSQRVLNLEESLGAQLLMRERGEMRPTSIGEKLLRYAHQCESLEGEFLGAIKDDPKNLRGMVRVGGFSTVMRSLVLPGLNELVEKHPKVRIEFRTGELRELESLLRSSAVDFLVHSQMVSGAGVRSELLGYEQNVLVRAKGALGKRHENVFLDHDPEDMTSIEFLKLQGKSAGKLDRMYLDEVYGIIDGVKLGWGVSVLPKHLIDCEKDLEVVPGRKPLNVPVYLNFYDQMHVTALQQRAVECIRASARKVLKQP